MGRSLLPAPFYMPVVTSSSIMRTRMSIPDSVSDAVLESILDGVEATVELFLGYSLVGGSVVKYLTGDGTQRLVLPDRPVLSVTEVREDADGRFGDNGDAYGTDTILTAGEGYAVEIVSPDGVCVLHRLGGVWPYRQWRGYRRLANSKVPCEGSVMVTFLLDDCPGDVKQAIYLEAAAQYSSRKTGFGVQTSSSLDARSVSVTPFGNMTGNALNPFISPAAYKMLSARRRSAIY